MNPIPPSHSLNMYQAQQAYSTRSEPNNQQPALAVEQGKVTLSAEGKALLAALQQIEQESPPQHQENQSVTDKVSSFTHGALGMDHPDDVEEAKDDSYSAGQYVSGALTIGGLLLALI